jgi:DNA primase
MARTVPPSVLEEILYKTDVLAVMGSYLKLRRQGNRYLALCPFHQEKTPSFSLNPEKGVWYCFGCSQGGSILDFIRKVESLSFIDAARFLAEKAGVRFELSEEEARGQSEREGLLDILRRAASFYHRILLDSQEAQAAREYLSRRSISLETQKAFLLGYAPHGDELRKALARQGASLEDAVKAGLLRNLDDGGTRDYFHDRIIFPIHDPQARVIGLGGRVMDNSQPKYLNTAESPVFTKGKSLYALHLAKNTITRQDEALVAEGYMDVIAMHQAGIQNAVATLGTALTEQQAFLIRRYCSKCVLGYDSDRAGQAATLRGLEIFEGAGLLVRILVLPEGEDPDSLIRVHGPERMRDLLRGAQSIVDYQVDVFSKKHDIASPEGKAGFVREIMPVLGGIRDLVRRDEYVKRIAERFEIREEVLRRAKGPVRDSMEGARASVEKSARPALGAEEILVALLLQNPGLISHAMKELCDVAIPPGIHAELLDLVASMEVTDGPLTAAHFSSHIHDEVLMGKVTELLLKRDLPPGTEEQISGLINTFRLHKMEERRLELAKIMEAKLAEGRLAHDDPDFIEYQRLNRSRKGAR